MKIAFRLNGREVALERNPAMMTLAVLREDLGMTSVRGACGIGLCGTCTVIVDGMTTSTCLLPIGQLQGCNVETVEAMPEDHRVLRAFQQAHAFQCGFCIPAMAISVRALLAETPAPSDEQINAALSGNICRCGCYLKIRDAVHLAAAMDREETA